MTDQFPTVREVLEGEAKFPSTSYHDEKTGMYVAPEPETVDTTDMIKDADTGLFLPKPKSKTVTRIFFSHGLVLDVSESVEQVQNAFKTRKQTEDVYFTGPVFPDEPVIIKATHIKDICAISVDYRDLDEIETAIKQKEFNLRMTKQQMDAQASGKPQLAVSGPMLPFPFGPNGRKGRR